MFQNRSENLRSGKVCTEKEINHQNSVADIEENSSIFNAAIEKSDYNTIHGFLKSGFNPNNPFTANCVRLASLNNDLKVLKLLIEYGADVNSNAYIDSALCVAIENGYAAITEFLIYNGALTHETNSAGFCLLHTAIRSFKRLTSEARGMYHTFEDHLSHIKREYDYFRIITFLLEKDSSRINETCCLNRTALCSMTVELYDCQAVVAFAKLLIKFGADVNIPSGKQTPLFLATERCQDKLAKVFLKHGASIAVKIYQNNQMNILHYAIKKNRCSIVKLMMNYISIPVNSEEYYYHALPLVHYVVKKARPGILRAFLISGADVTIRDKNGCTLLETYSSCRYRYSQMARECARLIIFYLVLLKERDNYQFTSHDFNCMYLDFYAFKYLGKVLETKLASEISKTLPITCFSIFDASDADLAKLVRKYDPNSRLGKDLFQPRHRVCKDLLESLIAKGRKRLRILSKDGIVEKIGFFLSPLKPLDIDCVEKILDSLNNVDLRNLVRACKIGTCKLKHL